MKQINISRATAGMVVAKPIYDEKNRILVNTGAVLSEQNLKKLIEMGFSTVCIDTEDTKNIILEDIVPITTKNRAIQSIHNLDMPSIIESAKEIVACISESNNLSFDFFDARDRKNYDYQHAVTVAEFSIAMGKLVIDSNGNPLSQNALYELAIAALLHDIGKRCSDRKILEQLNVPLDKIEYSEEMAPVFSYNLLKDNSLISATARVGILFHKTDENGKGAPMKVEPAKIHLFSKILHIADTYDTLINKGLNEDGNVLSSADAIEHLMANCNTKFNSDLVRNFVHYIPIYPKGSHVKLSNNMSAIVYENTVGQMTRPKVILEDGRKIDLYDYPSITVIGESVNYEEVSKDVKSR